MVTAKLTEKQIAEIINGLTERKNALLKSLGECMARGDNDGAKMCTDAIKLGEETVFALVNAALGKH